MGFSLSRTILVVHNTTPIELLWRITSHSLVSLFRRITSHLQLRSPRAGNFIRVQLQHGCCLFCYQGIPRHTSAYKGLQCRLPACLLARHHTNLPCQRLVIWYCLPHTPLVISTQLTMGSNVTSLFSTIVEDKFFNNLIHSPCKQEFQH